MNRLPSVPVKVLLIEDNPGDVRLTQEAMKSDKIIVEMQVVKDGVEALAFLRREDGFSRADRPDLILLDLNLPKMNGRELLDLIKTDPDLKRIPVVILTGSKLEEDIANSYDLHANCYITKPVDFDQFVSVVRGIQEFWFTIVKLPKP